MSFVAKYLRSADELYSSESDEEINIQDVPAHILEPVQSQREEPAAKPSFKKDFQKKPQKTYQPKEPQSQTQQPQPQQPQYKPKVIQKPTKPPQKPAKQQPQYVPKQTQPQTFRIANSGNAPPLPDL